MIEELNRLQVLVRSVIERSFNVIRKDPWILLPFFIAYFAICLLLISLGGLPFSVLSFPFYLPALLSAFSNPPLFIGLVSLSGTVFILFGFVFLYVLAYAFNRLEGLPVNFSSISSLIIRRLLPMIGLGIMAVFFFFLLLLPIYFFQAGLLTDILKVLFGAIPSGGIIAGFLALLIFLAALFFMARSLVLYFSFPYIAVLLENAGPIAAFKRSAEVARKDAWAVIRTEIVAYCIFLFILYPYSTAIAMLTFIPLPPIALNIVLMILGGVFPLIITFYAVLRVVLFKTMAVADKLPGRSSWTRSFLSTLLSIIALSFLLVPSFSTIINAPRSTTVLPKESKILAPIRGSAEETAYAFLNSLAKKDVETALRYVPYVGTEPLLIAQERKVIEDRISFIQKEQIRGFKIVSSTDKGYAADVIVRTERAAGQPQYYFKTHLSRRGGGWKVLGRLEPIRAPSMNAPDFTLIDLDGNPHTLSAYRGKVVLLNFWGIRAPSCRKEMLAMQKLYSSWDKNKYIMLAVNLKEVRGKVRSKDEVRSFAKMNGYSFPILLDEKGKVTSKYRIYAVPTTFIIDENGNIRNKVEGSREWSLDNFNKSLP